MSKYIDIGKAYTSNDEVEYTATKVDIEEVLDMELVAVNYGLKPSKFDKGQYAYIITEDNKHITTQSKNIVDKIGQHLDVCGADSPFIFTIVKEEFVNKDGLKCKTFKFKD